MKKSSLVHVFISAKIGTGKKNQAVVTGGEGAGVVESKMAGCEWMGKEEMRNRCERL
jgi:hypothetical protein